MIRVEIDRVKYDLDRIITMGCIILKLICGSDTNCWIQVIVKRLINPYLSFIFGAF